MQESTLTKLALIITLIGLVGLYMMSSVQEVPTTLLTDIEDQPDGATIKVQGVVQRTTDLDNLAFLTIAQEKVETVTVVVFKDQPLEIPEGSYVEIEGTLEEYEGKKEIIANQIEIR